MVEFQVAIVKDDASKLLRKLRREMPSIDRLIRGRICERIVSNVQRDKLRGQVLHRRTGDLAAHLLWRHLNPSTTAVGTYGIRYGRIHELGGVIVPRRAKALVFKIGKEWIRTKRVVMPKRPWLLPGILETFYRRNQAERIAINTLQQELRRIQEGK